MNKPPFGLLEGARVPQYPVPSREITSGKSRTHSKWVSWLLSIGVLLVYLSFPTRTYYWDGISFALAIETSPGLSATLIHPHHLLYNVFGFFIYHLVNRSGLNIRALQALQITNAILGALCAYLLFRLLRHATRSTYLSAVLTLFFSFSATWWKYVTDVDAYVASLLLVLASLNLVLAAQKPKPLLVGLTHSASMCLHQLAVFCYPVIVLGIFLQNPRVSISRRVLQILKYTGAASFLTLAVNYLCFHLQTRKVNLTAFAAWLTSYLQSPHNYSFSFDFWNNLTYTLRGHARIFFGGRFTWLEGLVSLPIVALIGILILIICVLGFNVLKGAREINWGGRTALELDSRLKTLKAVCSVWVGVYLIFLFFWYPYFTPYRVFYLPALILLCGITLTRYETLGSPASRSYAAMFVTAVALSNFLFFVFPLSHIEKNPALVLALEMTKTWPPATVIYYVNSN